MGKKGKAPKGRAKQKQKAQKSGNYTPQNSKNMSRRIMLDDDDEWGEDDNAPKFRGFAQNSKSSPFTPRMSEEGMANMHIDSSEVMEVDETTTASTETRIIVDPPAMREPSPALGFVVDTVGDSSLATKTKANGKRPVKRAPSPARSDSSEEVVFRGRNQPASRSTVIDDPFSAPPQQARPPDAPARSSPHPTDDLLRALNGSSSASKRAPTASSAGPSVPQARGWGAAPSIHDTTQRPQDEWTPASSVPYWKQRKTQSEVEAVPPEQRAFPYAATAESTAASRQVEAESSAALKADWKKALSEKKAAKKRVTQEDTTTGSTPKSDRRGKRGRKKDNRAMRNAPISDDEDFGMSEAAYDDYMQNLMAQLDDEDDAGDGSEKDGLLSHLRANAALAGPSLVVDGREIGEDELLDENMEDDDEENESDWASYDSDEDELSSDSDAMDSSDLEAELEYTEREQWEDEEDIRQRRVDRMTDEQIARLLAKQQELGIDGDELIIDDGMYESISEDGFGDVAAARAGLSDITNLTSGNRGMRRRGGDKKFNFPNASALADSVEQYGESGFDIMDFERPSLRPTKKGRKGKLPPALEYLADEDLKATLAESWDADRKSKRAKKIERQELRRQGLLGTAGRKGKADLDARYPLGMTMRNVHDEIRDFLEGDFQERAFPPMDKANRKALHEICTALNLNSKSQGAGKKRFPVIYKTSRTREYDETMFFKITSASSRGFLSNHSKAKKFAKKTGGPGRGGGFDKAAVSLRNGAEEGGKVKFSHATYRKRVS
ncbi:Protein SQS1 [Pseudocercospora fuligena]|uniref:Protein SQS1 n=1 Tax=Pseudocercospora fuligena TaxID=685502 RepID=A0A8H6VGM4_9PEZI|nr:Protein SQS1 [Pseudocercospora fuligena]